MVTDLSSNYTSPAGRECTMAAGKFAMISPASRVLDLGCGYGEGAVTIASEFRASVTAIDTSLENLVFAKEYARSRGVAHLITFLHEDITTFQNTADPFDLVLVEGGVLSFVNRRVGIAKAREFLCPRGWLAFSDLVLHSETVDDEIKTVFEENKYHYETEATYRPLLRSAGFELQMLMLIPQSGWDNYYALMAKRLEDNTGFFADKRVKLAFHREIDVFYRLNAFSQVGYLFGIARKGDDKM